MAATGDEHHDFRRCFVLPENARLRLGRPMTRNFILVGAVFGKLTVIAAAYKNNDRCLMCRCECGEDILISSSNIKKRTSCGCEGRAKKESSSQYYAVNSLLTTYVANAKARGRTFSLTREQFEELISSNCYYCDAPPSRHRRTKFHKSIGAVGFAYNGIDRENPNIGYEPANSRACCAECNFAKGTLTADAYFALCNRVARRAVSLNRGIFD